MESSFGYSAPFGQSTTPFGGRASLGEDAFSKGLSEEHAEATASIGIPIAPDAINLSKSLSGDTLKDRNLSEDGQLPRSNLISTDSVAFPSPCNKCETLTNFNTSGVNLVFSDEQFVKFLSVFERQVCRSCREGCRRSSVHRRDHKHHPSHRRTSDKRGRSTADNTNLKHPSLVEEDRGDPYAFKPSRHRPRRDVANLVEKLKTFSLK